MNVAIISGSSREDNNTIRLALAMASLFEEANCTCSIVDFKAYDIPFIHEGDITHEGKSAFQTNLIRSINEANLVITLSPEYNWFPSAELVNMIHQLGTREFAYLFENKVFAFAGVSSGKGGRLPAMQLSNVFEKIISYFHVHSITSPKKFEGHYIHQEIDVDGKFIGTDAFKAATKRFVDYNLQLAVKFV
jgi:chromate reductase